MLLRFFLHYCYKIFFVSPQNISDILLNILINFTEKIFRKFSRKLEFFVTVYKHIKKIFDFSVMG